MYRALHLLRLAILVILALLIRADSHTMTPVQSGSQDQQHERENACEESASERCAGG